MDMLNQEVYYPQTQDDVKKDKRVSIYTTHDGGEGVEPDSQVFTAV